MMKKGIKHIIGTKEQILRLEKQVANDYSGHRLLIVLPASAWSDKWTLIISFKDRNERRRFYRKYGIRGSHIGGHGHTCAYFINKAV